MTYGVEYHAVLCYSSSRFIFISIFLASMLAVIYCGGVCLHKLLVQAVQHYLC